LIPEQFRPFLALNPLAGIIDGFRACVFPARGVDVQMLSISLVMTVVVFLAGTFYFRKTERWFADII
jgi:ABC-type polysaccharide/polyol phosphate export permease